MNKEGIHASIRHQVTARKINITRSSATAEIARDGFE